MAASQMPVGTGPARIQDREPIVYRGERVLTTELAAQAFGTDEKVLSNNYDRNRLRFEEGKHLFKLTGAELREVKHSPSLRGLVAPQAPHLTLWTERGIARHAKILETDTAWDIFEELEETYFRVKAAGISAAPALPNFADPAAAARAWAEQYEARVIAERTKAEIGSRREATAMNTASQAVRRAGRLAIELDRSRQYATVKRMQLLHHGQEFAWRLLKQVSAEMGTPPIDVFDQNYGTVKAYHADVWREAYALDILTAADA